MHLKCILGTNILIVTSQCTWQHCISQEDDDLDKFDAFRSSVGENGAGFNLAGSAVGVLGRSVEMPSFSSAQSAESKQRFPDRCRQRPQQRFVVNRHSVAMHTMGYV
jgi:hypothetical protein